MMQYICTLIHTALHTFLLIFNLSLIYSDFLMMVLRDLVMERSDLHIILMSATLNAKLFSEYFCDAPVIHIPGTYTAYFKQLKYSIIINYY